jgi:hypothetical protein
MSDFVSLSYGGHVSPNTENPVVSYEYCKSSLVLLKVGLSRGRIREPFQVRELDEKPQMGRP